MPTGKKMKREIKFRAWVGAKEEKSMSDPFTLIEAEGILNPFWDEPVMQFTGLKDCKGKEIYEGDILKDFAHYPISYQHKLLNQQGIAVFSVEMGGYYILPENNDNIPINAETLQEATSKNYEVIGNIYENPELLTKGETK